MLLAQKNHPGRTRQKTSADGVFGQYYYYYYYYAIGAL